MPLENCSMCGKVFSKTVRDICPSCWDWEQSWVEKIGGYLHGHQEATAAQVIKELGIREDQLLRLLRRGRLSGYEQLTAVNRCERCGGPVDRGTMCATCRAVVLELTADSESPEPQDRPPPGKAGLAPESQTGRLAPDFGSTRQDIWQRRAH